LDNVCAFYVIINNQINKRMKKILLLMLVLVCSLNINAQETTKPLTDTEVVRKVSLLDVEGNFFYDVVMTFKSTSPDYFLTDKYKVKVTVKDSEGKVVWKKTLKNVFLAVFSDGQVQVGKQNFNMIIVAKDKETGQYLGQIREKEGVY